MKPLLVSALALGCAGATLVATTGSSQAASTAGPQDRAETVAAAHARDHAGLGAGQGLVVRDTVVDADGASHVRFDRTYRGLPVVGGDLVVHQTRSGAFRSTSGRDLPGLPPAVSPAVPAKRAAGRAAALVDLARSRTTSELVVLATSGTPALAWRVEVTGRNADGSPAGEYVFVNARKGGVLDRWPSVLEDTGSGTGLFSGTVPLETTRTATSNQLVDPVRGQNATYNGPYATGTPLFTDADNVWGNGSTSDPATAAVDAHYGIARTWDYYRSTFNRNGIADDGKGARSYVHDGQYVNASWSDSCFCMRYGDGDATTYLPLVELDIAGHEMTHGVTSRTAGLTYRGESGGLNEATSDIFGTSVEFYAANADDTGDYVIGEEIFRSYDPATNFIRRMDKPSLDGASQDCWSNRTKSVDVHYSSGVGNHFFYLLSEGSGARSLNGVAYNSPTCNGTTTTGIGRSQAAAVWYRALTVYMTSGTSYSGARVATINAATDLYGAASTQVAAVKAAWAAVSVK